MRNKNRKALTDWIAQNKGELAITLTFLPNITEARARKMSSFRPSQLARGIFDGAHLLFRQLVHRPLLETSPDKESPQSQEGIQNQ